jgi:hypothetical protein
MLFGQQLLSEFLLLRLKNRDVYEVMEMYLVLSFTQNSVLLAGMVREGVREFFEPALCAEDREFVVQAGGKFAGYDEDVG